MPGIVTGRRPGRPKKADAKGPYIPKGMYPEDAIARLVQDLTVDAPVKAQVVDLATKPEARVVGVACIAHGLGFRDPGSAQSISARLRAYELLSRLTGDLQGFGGHAALNVQINNNTGDAQPSVTFIRPELPGETDATEAELEVLPAADGDQPEGCSAEPGPAPASDSDH